MSSETTLAKNKRLAKARKVIRRASVGYGDARYTVVDGPVRLNQKSDGRVLATCMRNGMT